MGSYFLNIKKLKHKRLGATALNSKQQYWKTFFFGINIKISYRIGKKDCFKLTQIFDPKTTDKQFENPIYLASIVNGV